MKNNAPMPDHPKAYLFRAVRNAARNTHRVTGREVVLEEQQAWFVAASGAIEDSLALQAALLQLPREQREVIVMHIWGEMSFEDVALVVDVSPNTVASRFRYGLSKLRTLMQPAEVYRHATNE